MRGPGKRHLVVTVGASLTVLLVTACSSGSSGDDGGGGGGGDGLPDTIPITLIADKTGPLAFYGTQLEAGVRAGMEYVNESDLLGGAQIELTVLDTASTVATASAVVSDAIGDDPAVLLGPSLGQEALATAPIAQQAGIPYLVDTSPPGITDPGEYIWSMTTPHSSQMDELVAEVSKDNDSVTFIYASDSPTTGVALADLATELFDDAGVEVVDSIDTTLTTTDFTSVGTRAIQSDSEAIGIFGGGPMMPSIITTLREQGFEGQIFGNMGADGTIDSAGEAANGFRYMASWAPGLPGELGEDFTERFTRLYPDLTPHYPAVDGYTEMLFLGQVFQQAGSIEAEALLEAMTSIAEEGFDGPAGRVEFEGRQLVGPAIYVEFQDGATSQVGS
jgi:branched-chain amino acid transport system substrate-binding protein